MSGLRRGVKGRRIAWGIILSVLVVSITLVCSGIALADKWTDISDAQWQSQYGVTAAQAATVAGGFQDGSFHPKEAVKRGQFAKMVVDGFGVSTYSPSTSTFPDVAKSSTFFKYIEGGVKAGIISGYPDGTFKPNNTVTRQQANNILGAYLSDKELDENGVITGSRGTYGSLSAWYGAEGALILAAFKDAAKVAAVHAPGTAYLVFHEVVKGSNGALTPGSTLTRAQAVALIIRVREADFGGGPMPTVTSVSPAAGLATGGNGVIITGTNFTGVSSVKFGTTSSVFTVNSTTQITATAPAGSAGTTVDIIVTTTAGTSVAGTGTKYSYGQPVVTQLAPAGGSANGNTTVNITGTGFTGVTAVKFGNIAAKTYTVVSPTSITAVSPAAANGTVVDVTVTTPAGTSAASTTTKYTYGVPTIAKLEPAAGPATGATSVVITGTGFVDISGAAGVKFGTVNATSYTVNTSEKITAIAPAGTAGTTVDVIITSTIGQSGTAGMESKYSYGVPTITKLNPTGGPEAGGTSITITGTGFTGVSAVKFGTVAAKSFIVSSPTTMTAVAPAGTAGTTVEVYITTPAGTNVATGTANDYSYGVPTITAVTPAAGPTAGANSVVITGTNFVGITLAEQVKFGTKNATAFTVNSSTQITATVPSGTAGTTVPVTITNAAGASASSAAAMYSYGIPVVTSIDPAAGPLSGANSVVINGTGFTGVSAVKFGATTVSYTVNSATKITATAPSGALDTIVDVTVTTPAGVSVSSDATSDTTDNTKYRYILSPTVSSISPISGPVGGGNVVTVLGTYFVKGYTTVKFGSNSATEVNVISDTELTCKAPSGTSGQIVSVIVFNPVGQSPNTLADDYAYGMPTITSLNPAARSNDDGSSTVVITGTAFAGVTSVRFYYDTREGKYVDATSFTVNSLTQITAVVPDYNTTLREGLTDRTVDVVVTNGTGSSDTGPASKYAYGLPVISSLTPAGGSVSGGNSVTITGYGFTGTAGTMSVMFGASPATITSINTSPVDDDTTVPDERNLDCTKIVVTAPAHASGAVDVKVTTPAGTSGAQTYTYGIPTVTALTPAAGIDAGGNSVVITGTGFVNGGTDVWFGNYHLTSGDVTVDSSTQLTVIAPAKASISSNPSINPYYPTVDITVSTDGGSSRSVTSKASKYSFGKPTVTNLNPNGGPNTGGNTVVITGTGFTGMSGANAVKFGTVNAASYVVDNPYQITAVAPAPGVANPVNVFVTNNVGTSDSASGNLYTYGIPTIASISPAAGVTSGSTSVTITGTNFSGVDSVQFGLGHFATTVSSNAAGTQITCKTPVHAQGTVDVIVTVDGVTNVNNQLDDFSFGVPTVTSLDPTGGPTTAGTAVKIYGDGFTGVTAVKFGSTAAVSYTVVDHDQINAVAPAGTGTVNVTVTNPVGTSSTADTGDDYTYGAPTLTSISPAAGFEDTLVIITGTNFTGINVADYPHAVKFGGTDAKTYIVNDATHITAQAPGGFVAGTTVDVTITNLAGTTATSKASKFSYGAPIIESLSPNTDATTRDLTITGKGFTGVTDVTFGGLSASNIVVVSPTQITCKAPVGTVGTKVDVQVVTPAGGSDTTGAADDYRYGLPTITEIERAAAPTTGVISHTILIHGTNFVAGTIVKVDGITLTLTTDYVINSATQITVTDVPSHSAGTVDITVENGAGVCATGLATKFTYGDPSVDVINPGFGPISGTNTVVITGSGFTGVISVTFGAGYYATNIVVNSPTQITCKAPAHPLGLVNVTVTTWGGADTKSGGYQFQ